MKWGMDRIIILGMLIIIIGCVVLFIGVIHSLHKQGEFSANTTVKTGGIVLIGPIPIIFGTDKNLLLISIGGAILFLLAFLIWRNR
jgi:uncharacterized protein (TIGR00304 family)